MWYVAYNWFVKGGPVMYPIALFSFFGLLLVIERFLFYSRLRREMNNIKTQVEPWYNTGQLNEIKSLCNRSISPVAKIILIGIETNKSTNLREVLDDTLLVEVPKLEHNLGTIATIATLEPMLGLLGTVTGMIRCFNVIALKGTGDPQALAGGISEALITTEAGLIIAIPLLYLHHILSTRVDRIINETEQYVIKLVDLLNSK